MYQEVQWRGKYVWVTGIKSKRGKMHRNVREFVGRGGVVVRESKNGMLLVQFKKQARAIPAGCLTLYTEVKTAN